MGVDPARPKRDAHPARRWRAGRERGFTLVEALIALALLALVSLLGYQAVDSLALAEQQVASASARWSELDQVFARFEADLRAAIPRAVRHGAGSEAAMVVAADASQTIVAFSRAGPEFVTEPASAGQRLAYRWRRGGDGGGGGGIDVSYWPVLDSPDREPAATLALAERIAEMRVALLSERGQWLERWPAPGEPPLPRAVQLSLRTGSGEWIERRIALR